MKTLRISEVIAKLEQYKSQLGDVGFYIRDADTDWLLTVGENSEFWNHFEVSTLAGEPVLAIKSDYRHDEDQNRRD